MRVGFVGLGVMGEPMAGHLVTAGFATTVWNRTSGKAGRLEKLGATVAPSLENLAACCDVIFICVGRTEDVHAVLDEMLPAGKPGTLYVDHSTISPDGAIEAHGKCKINRQRFLDAPITGGSAGAQNGQLTIFCGGKQPDFENAAEFMVAYAKRAELVGGPGAGQTMKLANQIAVGGALLALCESMAFANKAGLDLELTREMLLGGAAASWAFQNYGPQIINRDWSPGFSIVNQRKDFGYCKEAASAVGANIPGTLLVDELLEQLERQGRGNETTSALYKVLSGEDF